MKASKLIKTSITAFIVKSVFCMATAVNAQAGQCPLISVSTKAQSNEAMQLFNEGEFLQLEAMLEKQHQINIASDGGDWLTIGSINGLFKPGFKTESLVLVWANQQQKSFFAQLTVGAFYVNQAGLARGSKFASETSQSQFKEMARLHAVAVGYLQKAMQLEPGSALPQSAMMTIAARGRKAAGKNAEQWLQAAIQADPKTMAARVNATSFLTPRWGGSLELLDQMVLQAEESLPAGSAHFLEYRVTMEKARHEESITKNESSAHTLYKRAKEMCMNSEEAQRGINRTNKRTETSGGR
jgi:hypothetical protein